MNSAWDLYNHNELIGHPHSTVRFWDLRYFHSKKFYENNDKLINPFNNQIALAGVRTWVKNEYRHLSLNKEYLLVEHKKWCIGHDIKLIALSFNDYNKNIIEIFKRNRLGEKNERINKREPKNLFYNGIEEFEFPVIIQYTPQWVIYEKLDKNFNFNWESVK